MFFCFLYDAAVEKLDRFLKREGVSTIEVHTGTWVSERTIGGKDSREIAGMEWYMVRKHRSRAWASKVGGRVKIWIRMDTWWSEYTIGVRDKREITRVDWYMVGNIVHEDAAEQDGRTDEL